MRVALAGAGAGGNCGSGVAGRPRLALVSRNTRGARRPRISHVEVSQHVLRCGKDGGEFDRRRGPAYYAGGPGAARAETRRTTAVMERRYRRDEPGGAAAASA